MSRARPQPPGITRADAHQYGGKNVQLAWPLVRLDRSHGLPAPDGSSEVGALPLDHCIG